jgi:sugar porter (SP) family MFS transporter
MSQLIKADLDHLEKTGEELTDRIVVEIDAGVYYEVNETQVNEDIATLEEELARSGKKPYVLGRLIKNPNVFIWVLAVLASISGFLFGVDQSLISGASIYLPKDLNLNDSELSMVVGFTPLGAIFGALIIMPVNEAIGRKYAIICSALLFTAGAILEAAAQSFGVLLAGRMILGSALGLMSGTVPAYIAENCAIKWRGGLVTLYQCMVAFGVMCGYVTAAIFDGVKGNWRYMLGSSVVYSTILFFGMLLMPESSRWLMQKGRKLDSYLVWKTARGFEALDERKEFFIMERVILYEKDMAKGRWVAMDLFTRPRCLRALAIAVSYQFLGQQLSGINSIEYYQATLMEATGLSPQDAVYSSLIGGGAMFLSTIPVIFLIDRLGRRTMALTFIPGVCVGLFVTGFSFLATSLGTRLGVYLTGMILFTAFWSLGVGAGPWVVASEVYPSYLRSYGVSIAALSDWVGTFVTTYPFEKMSVAMTSTGVFAGFYCGITVLIGVIVLLFMPETKNLSLEAINQVFEMPTSEVMRINMNNLKVTWNDLMHFRFKKVWAYQ